MSRHDQGSFDPTKCFQMPTSEGKRGINRTAPVKGEWYDKAGIRHTGNRMSARWTNGRGIEHKTTPPQLISS